MRRTKAQILNGWRAEWQLMPDATHQQIVAAFRREVKKCHPDTGFDGSGSIDALVQARDLLLEALESQKCTCKLCQGVGQVRRGMAWGTCSACRGKGETR